MKILVKRFDKTIPMPEYKTSGAAAFDLAARVEVTVGSGEIALVPLNVAIKLPEGCVGILVVRSSTHKLGLMPANGVGIIDEDYCGENDEYKLAVWNFTDNSVTVEKGARVAQLVILKKERVVIEEVEKLGGVDRGGFGTTGE